MLPRGSSFFFKSISFLQHAHKSHVAEIEQWNVYTNDLVQLFCYNHDSYPLMLEQAYKARKIRHLRISYIIYRAEVLEVSFLKYWWPLAIIQLFSRSQDEWNLFGCNNKQTNLIFLAELAAKRKSIWEG